MQEKIKKKKRQKAVLRCEKKKKLFLQQKR